ncbi:hypothetical protein OROGR_032219 [Orobanche gracilis]
MHTTDILVIMKTSHLTMCFLNLFSIYYTISLLSTPAAAAEQPSPVLDTKGNQVHSGAHYYILPVVRGRGGGLTLSPTGNKTCPLNVVQEQSEVENGLPLTFRPVDPKKSVVRVSTDHNIKFSAATTCVQSTVWVVEQDESNNGEYLIGTGGIEGNPGGGTVSNWFKIEKYDDDDDNNWYKIVFCPTVCNYCKVICREIGVLVKDGKRVLGLTNDTPFLVMFKKKDI